MKKKNEFMKLNVYIYIGYNTQCKFMIVNFVFIYIITWPNLKTVILDQTNNEEHHCNKKTVSNDDFREECENCKHDQELAEGYDDIFPEPETMTLERRPQLSHDHTVDNIESRSSMTLPGDKRLRRYFIILRINWICYNM